MTQLLEKTSHAGWQFHDAYWVGACIFIAHFLWLSPSFLQRRKILFSLIVMTAFWPLTYTFSIFQIMRMRRLKP
jgi:apolipoprotein N-acyltransferase